MDICGVPRERYGPFTAKLKNYHRLGFPEGLEGRKGIPTDYTLEQAFKMALAAMSGITPVHAIKVVRAEWDNLLAKAKAGESHLFHPVSALASLTHDPEARADGLFFWPVGAIWNRLVDSGLWSKAPRATVPRRPAANKGGRPRHGAQVKSAPLGMRCTPELRARIEAGAAASGRSLTQQVEYLLRLALGEKPPEPEREAIRRIVREEIAASGMSAFGRDPEEGREAKPASPARSEAEGDAQTPEAGQP